MRAAFRVFSLFDLQLLTHRGDYSLREERIIASNMGFNMRRTN
jgi:hypothetical protein